MFALVEDLRHPAGADRLAALTDGETHALVHGDGLVLAQLHRDGDPIARQAHLDIPGQTDRAGHVRGAEEELRPIAAEDRRVPTALFLGQDVDLRLELRVRRDRAGSGENLTAFDLVALDASARQR